jgi:hypothetical protein
VRGRPCLPSARPRARAAPSLAAPAKSECLVAFPHRTPGFCPVVLRRPGVSTSRPGSDGPIQPAVDERLDVRNSVPRALPASQGVRAPRLGLINRVRSQANRSELSCEGSQRPGHEVEGEPEDPRPLVQDPGTPPELRKDLASAADAPAPPYDLEAGVERLAASIRRAESAEPVAAPSEPAEGAATGLHQNQSTQ